MTSNSKPTKPPSDDLAGVLGALAGARGYASQSKAADAAGVSQPFYNQVANGQRLPSSDWLNCIAEAWALSPDERVALHRAAAKAHGFEIDLSDRSVNLSEKKRRG